MDKVELAIVYTMKNKYVLRYFSLDKTNILM